MSITKIKEAAESIINRFETVSGRGEEATKQAMVLPMLSALGFDIWNPSEVCPEYEADVAIKKNGQKEKVDYAIVLGDKPRIFIEVKAAGEPLEGHQGQLRRYFMSSQSVSLGILTNGIEYRFFTDTQEPNIQDEKPFHIVRLDRLDQSFDVIARFQRDIFSAESIREYATELTYTERMSAFLQKELDVQEGDLSDELVAWILKSPGMYEGRVMQSVLDRFRPIAKTALQRVLSRIVRRIVADIDSGVSISSKPVDNTEVSPDRKDVTDSTEFQKDEPLIEDGASDVQQTSGRGIITTEEELECFAVIKRMFETSIYSTKTIFEPSRRQNVPIELGYKDTTAYFGIYFNKPSWWNMRLCLDGKTKWVGFDVAPEACGSLVPENFSLLPPTTHSNFRLQISTPQDLLTLSDLVFASFDKTIQDREKFRECEAGTQEE